MGIEAIDWRKTTKKEGIGGHLKKDGHQGLKRFTVVFSGTKQINFSKFCQHLFFQMHKFVWPHNFTSKEMCEFLINWLMSKEVIAEVHG
jgi:hypothetical protein